MQSEQICNIIPGVENFPDRVESKVADLDQRVKFSEDLSDGQTKLTREYPPASSVPRLSELVRPQGGCRWVKDAPLGYRIMDCVRAVPASGRCIN
jgi:hypothetical protein